MRVTVGASDLVLANIDGRVVAIGDLCLRCGRSLSTASLSGRMLTCSGCGWKYDVERGCVDGLAQPADREALTSQSTMDGCWWRPPSPPRSTHSDRPSPGPGGLGTERGCHGPESGRAQATMFTPPSTYSVEPDSRFAYGVARNAQV